MSSDSGTMDGEPKGGPEMEESIADRVASLVESCRLLKDAASAHSTRWQHETDALSKQAVTHVNTLKKLQGDVSSASEKDDINQQTTDKLEEELYKARTMLYDGDVATLLPAKANGFFLRMLLGPANVRATRKDSRYKVKEEYNAYRDRTAVMFLAFPVILLILKNRIWNGCFPALPVQVYQAWLLFFYTSLALRENILRVNGSDIRPWWVYHHYCAMVMALVSLTWGIQGHPSCIRKQVWLCYYRTVISVDAYILELLLGRLEGWMLYGERRPVLKGNFGFYILSSLFYRVFSFLLESFC
uniref:TMPIT-like protein n=1 Tax=Physcomitrium patens TaxID=3218 RepID=A0A7I4EIR6_PHYPA